MLSLFLIHHIHLPMPSPCHPILHMLLHASSPATKIVNSPAAFRFFAFHTSSNLSSLPHSHIHTHTHNLLSHLLSLSSDIRLENQTTHQKYNTVTYHKCHDLCLRLSDFLCLYYPFFAFPVSSLHSSRSSLACDVLPSLDHWRLVCKISCMAEDIHSLYCI